MFNKDSTGAQLLQIVQKKLDQKELGFWIENQKCYLWVNSWHYANKIKVGDLSLTKENYWINFLKEKERGEFLNLKFKEISDVELIEELKKRTQQQTIISLCKIFSAYN